MKILEIDLNGVLGLPDRTLDFRNPTTQRAASIVVVTGPSGAGKTLLLESIVAAKESAGSYGGHHGWRRKRADAAAAKVSIRWAFSEAEQDRFHLAAEYRTEAIFQAERAPPAPPEWRSGVSELLRTCDLTRDTAKLYYFHARRALDAGGLLPSAAADSTLVLASSNRKFAWLEAQLVQSAFAAEAGAAQQASMLDRFGELFASLCRSKTFAGVEEQKGVFRPLFQDHAGRRLGLFELSFGEQQAVLFAATSVFCHLASSVVLIDSPELGLSIEQTRRLVSALQGAGSNNQVVVATNHQNLIEGQHDFVVHTLHA